MSTSGRGSRRLAALVVVALTYAGLALVGIPPAHAATDPCGPGGNAISCENSKPGSPESDWEISGAGDSDIQGFSTDISVNAGSPISFKIDTDASAYTITIFRMGWYGGDGARQIATVAPSAHLPQTQPNCITDATTELTDCGNWGVSATWNVPSTAVSGVYIAHLYRADRDDSSNITFIVRNDASHSDIVFQTSDPTWEAYNTYGGSDFYTGAANGRAYKVSYNRPVLTRLSPGGQDFFMSNEYPLVRFLERNGYDISYMAGVDTDRYGSLIKNHNVFLSVGHDEYWSGAQRANVEAARDAGVNLQFLSGNEVYWRTRYEPSVDSSHTPYRTLVTYKEAWAQAKIDPSPESTSTWRDPRYAPKSEGGGLPENSLTGTIFMSNLTDLPVTVTKAEGRLRLWRNTGLSSMATSSTALAPHTIGYESDEDQDNGFRPPGLIDLSTTTGSIAGQYMTDYGLTTGNGVTTHSLTLYKAPSGALVFGAGSVQWTWGLDDDHDTPYGYEPADPRMQQAEVNLMADMGAQPTTLMSGMVAASPSTDTTGPSVVINTPAAGAAESNGAQVTVSGTATDAGGGVVAGVEYSTDSGDSWHPATGTSSWSFTYTQHGVGTTGIEVRAVDDSANIGTAVSRSFNVSCPCSIFGDSPIASTWTAVTGPSLPTTADTGAYELGLRFTAETDGFITGVRFYKGTGNTGTHVASLWGSDGQQLATATFTNEATTGWQTVTFSSPVAVTRGTTYVVSYTDPNGNYASQPWAFSENPVDAFPLTVDGGYGAQPAGVFGPPGTFPENSFKNTNYFVDPVFTTSDGSPLIATSQWPMPNSSSVPASTTISARFSKSVVRSSVGVAVVDQNGAPVAGSTGYDPSTRTVRFTPDSDLAGFVKYTVTLSATSTDGAVLSTGGTWKFTTARPPSVPGVCPCTLFDDSLTPAIVDVSDGQAITLGVRFSSTKSGVITGIRFYKAVTNSGTHVGTLWSADGTVLGQGTFTDESSFGWQTLTFDQPIPIRAGKQYIASYFSPTGHYSVTPNAFAAANLSRGPLQVSSTAGAYQYQNTFAGLSSPSNYLVDPVFEPRPPTIAVASATPPPGAVDVPRGTQLSVTFTNEVLPGFGIAVSAGGSAIPGASSLSLDQDTIRFKPSSPLPRDADVTVQLSNVQSPDGASLGAQQWQFHTADSDDTSGPESVFVDELPTTASAPESSQVELGMKFIPQVDGKVSAIRFYKGAGNGGAHVGSLWTSSGERLAQVSFTDETSSGWQTAQLLTPVEVTAGQTYVVSYYAPQGHYSSTLDYFTADRSVDDLTVPGGDNGVFLYGDGGGFPAYSYESSNYFVDVVFTPDAPSISVVGQTPAPGEVDVPRNVAPSISFSAPVADGYTFALEDGGTPIAGTVQRSADQKTLTFTPSSALPASRDLTANVTGIVSTRGASLGTETWTFHTGTGLTTVSLFADQVPTNDSVSDGSSVELGTAFTPSVNGDVTKVRFYKGSGNTGTHTGSIWSSSGQRLATVTFTNETATGWQEATLPTPLALTAGQTYVVSYYAPNGHYAVTGGYFSSPVTSGPLTAPASNNGLFFYASGGGFPTDSWNATNYFVDVVFEPSG